MKKLLITSAVLLAWMASLIYTWNLAIAKTGDPYKAACLMSDAIRLEYDNLDDSLKNCTFTAYSSLEEACCEEGIDTDSLLKTYYWCY